MVAVTDYKAAGYEFLASLAIETEYLPAEEVAQNLVDLNGVMSVDLVTGNHNIQVLVAAQTFEELQRFLWHDLAGVKGIGRMTPSLVWDVYAYNTDEVPPVVCFD